MSDIKAKIAKCLSLAKSPEEEEAKAALLTARKLMAKHKLSEKDILDEKPEKVVKATVNAHYTRMTDLWASALAKTIAEHHCCAAYSSKMGGSKTYTIGFIGLEEDFKVCQQVYLYAYEFVKAESERITKKMPLTATEKRIAKNSYGMGFNSGLKVAYTKQNETNKEWGIVLVTPPEVDEIISSIPKAKVNNSKHYNINSSLITVGFQAGKNFSPDDNRIAEN